MKKYSNARMSDVISSAQSNETRCPGKASAEVLTEVGFTDLSDSDEMTDLPWSDCQNGF